MAVVDKGMNRQQLNGGDSKGFKIFQNFRAPQGGIRTAQSLGDRRMQFGKSPDMHLIDDGVIPLYPLATARTGPIKARFNDDTFGHERSTIPRVEGKIVHRLHLIAENGWIPTKLSDMRASVRIKKQLVGIETMPRLWRVR